MSHAPMVPERLDPAIAIHDVEHAVAMDEQRIAIELADTVIRDLFAVGLTLQGALPMASGAVEQRLTAAVDGIDGIIRTIRDIVFALEPRPLPCAPAGADGSPVSRRR